MDNKKLGSESDFRRHELSDDGQPVVSSRRDFPSLNDKEKMIKNIKLPTGTVSSNKGKYFVS